MKFMTPLLMAALPAAAIAQSASGAIQPATTEVMVILTAKQGVERSQIMAVMPAEVRETVKLYLGGKIREWYSRGDGRGVIFFLDAKTVSDAQAIMDALPLAKEHLMDYQYIPVGPLMPLMTLIAPGAQR